MQWTVYGYSQEAAIDLDLDMVDLAIIRWIADFAGTKKMASFTDNGTTFYWIQYDYIIKEMPILGLRKAALANRLKRLANIGVLEHRTVYELDGHKGTYSFYGFGNRYERLITQKPDGPCESKLQGVSTEIHTTINQNSHGYESKFIGGINQNSQGVSIKIKTKDSTTNNSTTKDSTTNIHSKKSEHEMLIDEYSSNPDLRTALCEFIKMRKLIKKPMTNFALKNLLAKLDRLATADSDKIAMLYNAIEHCWQSVYPLKPDVQQPTGYAAGVQMPAPKVRRTEEEILADDDGIL